MISVIQQNQTYEIRFSYDPELVDLIKNVPGRAWAPDIKAWIIPTARLGFFLAQVKGTKYEKDVVIRSEEAIDVNEQIDSTSAVPDIDISDAHMLVAEGGHLYSHQMDTLRYAKYRYTHGLRSGFLLADEPGAGKTLSILNTADYMRSIANIQHCLVIVCFNSAKYNWIEDIVKHSNGSYKPYLLGSRLKRDKSINLIGSSKDKLEDLTTLKQYGSKGDSPLPFFTVMNIESVRYKEGKKYAIADKIIELVNSGYFGMIVIDEIHVNASMQSTQGKQLLRIKKLTQSSGCQWIPMTGTPITSKPTDLFLPLRLIDAHASNSFYSWCQNYCIYGGFGGYDIIGYKNMNQLKSMLQPNMLRRLKQDILDLPPKVHFTEYVENTEYQRKLYKSISEEIRQQREEIVKSLNPMTKLLRLRQVNGSPELVDSSLVVDDSYLNKNARLRRLIELVDDIVARGEKVVIFSNWVSPLNTLYKFLIKKYPVACYTGTMPQIDREQHKQAFINNDDCKVILGTVGALGVSHTLTVARNVIFYDCPWNPSDIEQCEDRCHRPGTSQTVNVYTLVTKDTIDERVHKLLSTKESTAKYIVDNNLDIRNHPELLDILLGHDN